MIGNGYCNDETNNADCNYDGGDCCKLKVNLDHCTECICHHQETCAAGVNHEWVNNGICNDETNHAECNFDGGDCEGCAGDISLIGNGVCNEENNNPQCEYDGRDCCDDYYTGRWPYYLGDGWCEARANIPQCDYDGGDCCLDKLELDWCCYDVCDEDNDDPWCVLGEVETMDIVDPSFCEGCQCLDPLKIVNN